MAKITNRKGDFKWDNLLGVIIAVLGIAIILPVIAIVYFRMTEDKDMESAKSVINVIEAKVNNLPLNKEAAFTIRGVNSENEWFLAGWNKDDINKPDKCLLKSCICVCDGDLDLFRNNYAQKCQERSICRFFDESSIVIEGSTAENKDYIPPPPTHIFIYPYIVISGKLLLVLEVNKTRDKIEFISYKQIQKYDELP